TAPLFQEEHSLFTEAEEDGLDEARAKDPYVGLKARSVRELQAWVDGNVRFDAGAADVPDLFPETHQVVKQAKEEADKIIAITHEYHVPPQAKDGNRWGEWQRERAKRKKNAAVQGSTGEERFAAEQRR